MGPGSFSSLMGVTGCSKENGRSLSLSQFCTNGIGSDTHSVLISPAEDVAGLASLAMRAERSIGGGNAGANTGEERGALGGSVESGGEGRLS